MNIEIVLKEALTRNQYALNETEITQLVTYLNLLDRWNQVYNLTAIRDPEEAVWLHIIDSLSIAPYLNGQRILDVGTGAGLPGIPLAITNPEKSFTLLDSNSKKTRFLVQAVSELGLKNVTVAHSRCEEFQAEIAFDTILSRAFSAIAVMLASTQHCLATNGQFLAMKGVYPAEELAAIPEAYSVVEAAKLNIKGLAAERHVVRLVKK